MAPEIVRHCTQCGQRLVLPVGDLRRRVRCPRCRTDYALGEVVREDVPVPVLPASERPPDPASAPDTARMTAEGATAAPALAAAQVPSALAVLESPLAGTTPAVQVPRSRRVPLFRQATADVRAALLFLLDLADSLDRRLYGHRVLIILSCATLSVFAPFVDDTFGLAMTTLFLVVVAVLGYARVGSFRGEDGSWHVRFAWERFSEAFSIAVTRLRSSAASSERFLVMAGKLVVGAALVVTPFRQFGEMIAAAAGAEPMALRSVIETLRTCAGAGFALGALLWLVGWRVARTKGQKTKLVVANTSEREALLASSTTLPLVIDASRDVGQLRTLQGQTEHPLLKEVLGALADWRVPVRKLGDEKRYEASLFRHLTTRIEATERQVPVGKSTDPNRGRVDIVVGEAILLELKRGWGATTVDRAVGQLWKYATHWKSKGPMILLLVEVEPHLVERRLSTEIERLRSTVPCLAIVAKAA